MSKENLEISGDIACLNKSRHRFTLISTKGYHSEVWRMTQVTLGKHQSTVDFMVKRHLRHCSVAETRILYRQYLELRRRLGDIVPQAHFICTRVDGVENVIVLAEPVPIWFNIANPTNEEEAIPLLQRLPRTRDDLAKFIDAAHAWYDSPDMRVIDLWGIDNLVLDTNRRIRYLDSFWVFFLADVLHAVGEPDAMVEERINVSRKRLEYLEYVLEEARKPR